MVIKFEVRGQELICKTRQKLVEKSSKFIECEFDFDSSWKDLTCLALFLPDGEKVPIPVIIQNNKCVVPNKLSYYGGYCKLAVVGGNGEFSDSVLNGDIISLDNTIASTNVAILMIEKTLDYSSVVADEELNSNFFTILNQIKKIGSDVKKYWDEINDTKEKIDGIESNAQVNVIEKVKVNGEELLTEEKTVEVIVPTNLTELNNDGNFIQDGNYVHTDKNYTAEEKEKLRNIEQNAQSNVIEKVKVNGEELSIEEKTVNVTVPTKMTELENDGNFANGIMFWDYIDVINWFNKHDTIPDRNMYDDSGGAIPTNIPLKYGNYIGIYRDNLPDLKVLSVYDERVICPITTNEELYNAIAYDDVQIGKYVFQLAGIKTTQLTYHGVQIDLHDGKVTHASHNFNEIYSMWLQDVRVIISIFQIKCYMSFVSKDRISFLGIDNNKMYTLTCDKENVWTLQIIDMLEEAKKYTDSAIVENVNVEFNHNLLEYQVEGYSLYHNSYKALAMDLDETYDYFNFGEIQLRVGQKIAILQDSLPDLIVSEIYDDCVCKGRWTDALLLNELQSNGKVRIGKYDFVSAGVKVNQMNDAIHEVAPFVVNINFGEEGITSDKTFTEILSVIQEGKNVNMRSTIYDIEDVYNSSVAFYGNSNVGFLINDGFSFSILKCNDKDIWDYTNLELATVEYTKDAIKKAVDNAATSAPNEYEFIKTLAVEEDGATTFTFNKDIDEKSFKLDKLIVRIQMPSVVETTETWWIGNTSEGSNNCVSYFVPGNKGRNILIKSERVDDGYWFGIRTNNNTSALNTSPMLGCPPASNVNYLESLYVSIPNAPVGTKVIIYGRKVS